MNTDNDKKPKPTTANSSKKRWQSMKVTYIGEAKDVVRSGGGKTSPNPADPGEVFKPPGSKT